MFEPKAAAGRKDFLNCNSMISNIMRLKTGWIFRWMWFAGILPFLSSAQEGTLAAKVQRFTQTSAAAPVLESGLPFHFEFRAKGLAGGNPTVTLALPSGATRVPSTSNLDKVFTDSAATASALNSVYGSGVYVLTLVAFGVTETGTATMPADNFPTVPQLANFTDAQAIDSTQDFELDWNLLAGATGDDYMELSITDTGGKEVYSDFYSGDNPFPSAFLNGGTLKPGQSYTATLSFTRVANRSTGDLDLSTGFISTTTFTLKTKSDASGPDTQPPSLSYANPPDGSTNVVDGVPISFVFSESMRTNIAITWSTNLDVSKFTYGWSDRVLVCYYDGVGGRLPAHQILTWTLNATPGAAGNFRDLAGNELPTTHGQLSNGIPATSGGGTDCNPSGLPANLNANLLLLTREASYRQTGDTAPAEDPAGGTAFAAFFLGDSNAPPVTVSLRIPSVPIHNLGLTNSAFLLTYFIALDSRSSAADLEAAYPAGSYKLTVRRPAGVTQTLDLAVGTDAPPVPQFVNTVAALTIDPTQPFRLGWLTGLSGTNQTLELHIHTQAADGSEGDEIYSAPDPCNGITLTNTATSILLPAGLFTDGHDYVATLTFTRLTFPAGTTDLNGLVQNVRQTRLSLHAGANTVLPPPHLVIAAKPDGGVFLTVESGVTRPLLIERAPTPAGPWETVVNLPSVPPSFTTSFDLDSNATAFFRAR